MFGRGILFLIALVCSLPATAHQTVVELNKNWKLSSKTNPSSVLVTDIPATVLGAEVDSGKHGDVFFNQNLKKIPGSNFDDTIPFARLPMPEGSPYREQWVYETEFNDPRKLNTEFVLLELLGVNYRANIFLNGKTLATEKEIVGTFRKFSLDITKALLPSNKLRIEVRAPSETDLATSWIDWAPSPADKNMGLFAPVQLVVNSGVVLKNPYVRTQFPNSFSETDLAPEITVQNLSNSAVHGYLQFSWEGNNVSQAVSLRARETRTVKWNFAQFPKLRMKNPKLWWPKEFGKPNLYKATFAFTTSLLDATEISTHFGVRKVVSKLTAQGHRQFYINGVPLLIRGAGYAQDLFLRPQKEKKLAEFDYVENLGLNTIRLEGHFQEDWFYDEADKRGILILAGLTCCDHWEQWSKWDAEDQMVAVASLKDQILKIRKHPSVFVWFNGSDYTPPEAIEKKYNAVLDELAWSRPVISSANANLNGNKPSKLLGPSGTKMTGPYEWVPPAYWYLDKDRGGAFGFNTETSPGWSIPSLESLRRFLPDTSLWPISSLWDFHAGQIQFKGLKHFVTALDSRYGKSPSIEEFLAKSNLQAYEAHRAMFEAFTKKQGVATGVIQWMLNSPWPSVQWNLFDYYLKTGGAYFGAKKGNEPVSVLFAHDDRKIWSVNRTLSEIKNYTLRARGYDVDGSLLWDKSTKLPLLPNSAQAVSDIQKCSILHLEMKNEKNVLVGANTYWFGEKDDELDWSKMNWQHTPQKEFTNLKFLEKLKTSPPIAGIRELAVKEFEVRVKNTSTLPSFFVELKAFDDENDTELARVAWSDNLFFIPPGEERSIRLKLPTSLTWKKGKLPKILTLEFGSQRGIVHQ